MLQIFIDHKWKNWKSYYYKKFNLEINMGIEVTEIKRIKSKYIYNSSQSTTIVLFLTAVYMLFFNLFTF